VDREFFLWVFQKEYFMIAENVVITLKEIKKWCKNRYFELEHSSSSFILKIHLIPKT